MSNNKPIEKTVIKSTLLNIDSAYRNITPKNICTSNNKLLPPNPFTLTYGSNIITVNYPNHNMLVNDNIVIQNVTGINKILTNYFFLINNFNYVMIIFLDNMIDSNYSTPLYALIELVGNQTAPNIINNITFNSIPGYKNILIKDNIPNEYYNPVKDTIISLINKTLPETNITNEWLNSNLLFIELPNKYITSSSDNYDSINQVFKITYQHIGGIQLGYFNSNFPISNINYQSSQTIYQVIDNNNFKIQLNCLQPGSYGNIKGGGNTVQIMKIINSMTGYPDANNYVINLKKSFSNVINIELISMEIPYIDIIITKNVNDKLYWKHIEDGDTIYYITMDEGFYSNLTLTNKLINKMNTVPRVNSSIINPIYNNFDIILESNIQKITFKPYNVIKIPNSLSITIETINNIPYYILYIEMLNNFVNINDIITISDASGVTCINNDSKLIITSNYINNTFSVYNVNLSKSTFSVILGNINEIIEILQQDDNIYNGDQNTKIKIQTQVSFLFNRNDTMGSILGFLNVGAPYSVIDFSSNITNMDPYIMVNNFDSAGNTLSYSSGFINLSGTYNYILMYMNNLEYIYFNNSLDPAFAKILLNGNPGDILFNTHINIPSNLYCQSFPISSLTEITINFLYPDGSPVVFRNINHSFTLKIIEEHYVNNNINLNSQNILVYDEYRRTYLAE
jgi:hypothetical protein